MISEVVEKHNVTPYQSERKKENRFHIVNI